MLAKAVYHDKWIKENLRARAVRQLGKWLSADRSISVDIYQRVSLWLPVCQGFGGGRDESETACLDVLSNE